MVIGSAPPPGLMVIVPVWETRRPRESNTRIPLGWDGSSFNRLPAASSAHHSHLESSMRLKCVTTSCVRPKESKTSMVVMLVGGGSKSPSTEEPPDHVKERPGSVSVATCGGVTLTAPIVKLFGSLWNTSSPRLLTRMMPECSCLFAELSVHVTRHSNSLKFPVGTISKVTSMPSTTELVDDRVNFQFTRESRL